MLTGHLIGPDDTSAYLSPEDCFEIPAGTTLTVQAQ